MIFVFFRDRTGTGPNNSLEDPKMVLSHKTKNLIASTAPEPRAEQDRDRTESVEDPPSVRDLGDSRLKAASALIFRANTDNMQTNLQPTKCFSLLARVSVQFTRCCRLSDMILRQPEK
jgi:hypothetical protein